jgi:ubiquinone/menaquinone biosynthesis C-methylase UbiE
MHRRAALLATHVVGRSVELGGGTGAVTEQLADRSRAFHSDISPRMCRMAINKLGRPSVCFDAESIPLADATIDTAVSGEMIYYLERPDRFIAEAYRVLRPKGRLVLSTTNAKMTFLERGRTLLRRLGFSRMFFDDGAPTFIAFERLTRMLEHAGFTIKLTRRIVVVPFASLDWLNRLLERTILSRFSLFIVLVAQKKA